MAGEPDSKGRRRLVLGLVGGAAALAAGWGGLVVYKDQRWVASPPYRRDGSGNAKTLVVVYSRSGNTLVAAKEAAGLLDADLATIETPDYPRSLAGQIRAVGDARNLEVTAEIHHPEFEASRYESIVLCSPVWLFRPAVPLWAFTGSVDFANRDAYLLMTGNSGYRSPMIEEFGRLVESRNGRLTGHHFVRRGRVYWQLTKEEVRDEVRRSVTAHFGL